MTWGNALVEGNAMAEAMVQAFENMGLTKTVKFASYC